jgi:DNA-binding NarL/FixJ family response regulator
MEFRLRVLIVDDEPLVRSLLTEVLKSLGYQMIGQLTKDWNLGGGTTNSFSAVLPMPRN